MAEPSSVTSIRESPVTHCESPVTHFGKRERHARTPISVLHDKRLSLSAKAIYAELAQHAFSGGKVYVGERRIASLLGCSQKTVSRCINELIRCCHIEKSESRRGRRSEYRILSNIFMVRQKEPAGIPVKRKAASTSSTVLRAKAWAETRVSIEEILDGTSA